MIQGTIVAISFFTIILLSNSLIDLLIRAIGSFPGTFPLNEAFMLIYCGITLLLLMLFNELIRNSKRFKIIRSLRWTAILGFIAGLILTPVVRALILLPFDNFVSPLLESESIEGAVLDVGINIFLLIIYALIIRWL